MRHLALIFPGLYETYKEKGVNFFIQAFNSLKTTLYLDFLILSAILDVFGRQVFLFQAKPTC